MWRIQDEECHYCGARGDEPGVWLKAIGDEFVCEECLEDEGPAPPSSGYTADRDRRWEREMEDIDPRDDF